MRKASKENRALLVSNPAARLFDQIREVMRGKVERSTLDVERSVGKGVDGGDW